MFRKFLIYIRNYRDINRYYSFSLVGKYGEQVPENLNWLERTNFWLRIDE